MYSATADGCGPKILAKILEFAAGKVVVFLTTRAQARRWLEQVTAHRSEHS